MVGDVDPVAHVLAVAVDRQLLILLGAAYLGWVRSASPPDLSRWDGLIEASAKEFALDPDLLRGRRFPLPSEAALRELPVFYRALIFDYFDRLNRSPASRSSADRRDPP